MSLIHSDPSRKRASALDSFGFAAAASGKRERRCNFVGMALTKIEQHYSVATVALLDQVKSFYHQDNLGIVQIFSVFSVFSSKNACMSP